MTNYKQYLQDLLLMIVAIVSLVILSLPGDADLGNKQPCNTCHYFNSNHAIQTLKPTSTPIITPIPTITETKPAYGSTNECEKLALNYQKQYGGILVFIQPLKANGAYDLSRFGGHWINKINNSFYNVETNESFINPIIWYMDKTGKNSQYWDFEKSRPPFALIRN